MKTGKSHASRRSRELGFSLLELIVVVVILGLLAGVVGIKVSKHAAEGRIATAKVQIENLSTAIETFRLKTGRYPTTSEGLRALVENPGVEDWDGPYLGRRYVPKDPWKHEYQYRSPGEHGDFDVWSFGADGVEGGNGEDADVTSWSE